MTFSEFIRSVAWEQYLIYCKQRRLQPVRDLTVEAQTKMCALVDKNFLTQQKSENA